MFWPVSDDRFNRVFLIDELSFPNDQLFKKWATRLGIDQTTIVCKNVYGIAENGAIVRIIFQTEQGTSYMLVVNKVNDSEPSVHIKGLHLLPQETIDAYLELYYKTKQELLATSCSKGNG